MNRRLNLENLSNQKVVDLQSKPLIPLSWLSKHKTLTNDELEEEPEGQT